ncbi:hypothetical protein HID58_056093 [Brassica napus]|uniref:Small ribosomal subunit protein uS5 n=1 Tax=Brassica napus TaxID=3708 RepID=A0ABQ8AM95_BRANA|nr:hypothetical protein HID58_056093 [Brassica napus]
MQFLGIISSVQSAYLYFSLLSSSPVRRGYWGNKIGKPHTVPCKVTGKCGSVTVRMVPAPRGAGIVAARVPKMVLQFNGIDDVFTSSRGSTKTLGNFVKSVSKTKWMGWKLCAWSKLYQFAMVRYLVDIIICCAFISLIFSFIVHLMDRWARQALFGTDAAKWICVSAIDVTQLSVAVYLVIKIYT